MLVSQKTMARSTSLRIAPAQRRVSVHVARPHRSSPADVAVYENMAPASSTVAFLAPFVFNVDSAVAKAGEFGILEGTTAALVHPAMMGFLFVSSVYTGYLGWQWRRTRTIGDEIKELKKALPAAAEDGTRAASPLDAQILTLEQDRKGLVAGGFKDKHSAWGSLLLGFGVLIAVEGCVNTFMRTEKLFPGPHLFAGAAIVTLWAGAAAMVPLMQKGDNNARSAHIAMNALNVALFAWQIPTGLEIVQKVFQFTHWP